MRRRLTTLLAVCGIAVLASGDSSLGCTNFLITRGASADGSVMITYSADSHEFYGELYYRPAARYPAGSKMDIHEWDSGTYLGRIDHVPATYAVVGNMNEHQVAIGETTWGGRSELKNPDGIVDYGSLMYLALQRARTAREAIEVMTGLVEEYGYHSTGESFSVSDSEEAWILEMIGKGPGKLGALWVARKVPDGYISGHANGARIRQFPLDDPENTLYAADVISFARERGWFDGPDQEFSYAEVYDPPAFGTRRFCDSRVWCMFRRAAPSRNLPADWVLGVEDAEPVPLWIRPDRKLSVQDVIGFMRDHFQGTELDMTTDVGAGPYSLPYRWRPLTWEVDGEKYFNERATSTQQTGFSFVAQSRGWLPDPIGGVLWFGVDDTYSTVYFPAYCGIHAVPHGFAEGTGSFHEVTWDAAFWVFNQVANFAYLRYGDMIGDIQVAQRELEAGFLGAQADVDAAAMALYERSPRLAADYLTDYSVRAGEQVLERWRKLSKELLYKYLDGNVKDEFGKVTHPGYPEEWYRMVAEATGERLRMRKLPQEIEREEERRRMSRDTAASLLALLEARRIEIDDERRAELQETEDLERLREWLVAAATAETAGDVFGTGD